MDYFTTNAAETTDASGWDSTTDVEDSPEKGTTAHLTPLVMAEGLVLEETPTRNAVRGAGGAGKRWAARLTFAAVVMSLAALLVMGGSRLTESVVRQATGAPTVQPAPEYRRLPPLGKVDGRPREMNLPTWSQTELLMPAQLEGGKWQISELLDRTPSTIEKKLPHVQEALHDLARVVTRGRTTNLVGEKLRLVNLESVGNQHLADQPTVVTVVGCFGGGSSRIVLAAVDDRTEEFLAVELNLVPKSTHESAQAAAKEVTDRLARNAASTKTALRALPYPEANPTADLAVPRYHATIEGLRDVLSTGEYFLGSRVSVMSRRFGSARSLLRSAKPLSVEAKSYIARRLLLSVLRLHQENVAHNDVSLDNVMMLSDGTAVLGGLESCTLNGTPMRPDRKINYFCSDPQLVVDDIDSRKSKTMVSANTKNDLFSVGIALYELFTDGSLPPALVPSGGTVDEVRSQAEAIMRDNPSLRGVESVLHKAGAPREWQDVIVRLLKPRRHERCDSEDIADEFLPLLM